MTDTFRISAFRRWRAASITSAALLSTLTGLALASVPPAKADTLPPPDCESRFVVLSLRGADDDYTGDPIKQPSVNYVYYQAVMNALINNQNTDPSDITSHNVDYPTALRYLPGVYYNADRTAGATALTAAIHQYDSCPGPRHPALILIGYSLGAGAVKKAMNDIASSGSPDADFIGAIINVADPSRSNNPPVGTMHTVHSNFSDAPAPDSSHGGAMEQVPMSSDFGDRYSDVCRDDDAFCNSDVGASLPEIGTQWATQSNAHESYMYDYAEPMARAVGKDAAFSAEKKYESMNEGVPPSPAPGAPGALAPTPEPSSTAPAPPEPSPPSTSPPPSLIQVPPVPSPPPLL